jgi:aryl-alcohol dehydrogenase-like predicted oxidoreductase
MQYTTLGQSDLEVSRIALGLWNISGGSDWDKTARDQAVETIHTAVDEGINFLDTAEVYGDGYSEEVLGEALQSLDRDDVVVATKAYQNNLSYEDVKASCEASLDRLGTDYVDVYYVHYHDPDTPFEETARAFRELQEEGKIRYPAVSNTGVNDLEATLSELDVVANQLPLNLLWRAIEYEVADACRDAGVDVVAYSPLGMGLLTGKYSSIEEYPEGRMRTRHFSGDRPEARHGESGVEDLLFETLERVEAVCDEYDRDIVDVALAWTLHQEGVACAIAGASTPEHVRSNAAAVDVDLSDDILADLDEATAELKEALGPNPDPWDHRYN